MLPAVYYLQYLCGLLLLTILSVVVLSNPNPNPNPVRHLALLKALIPHFVPDAGFGGALAPALNATRRVGILYHISSSEIFFSSVGAEGGVSITPDFCSTTSAPERISRFESPV